MIDDELLPDGKSGSARGELKPDMTAEVTISVDTAKEPVLTVPDPGRHRRRRDGRDARGLRQDRPTATSAARSRSGSTTRRWSRSARAWRRATRSSSTRRCCSATNDKTKTREAGEARTASKGEKDYEQGGDAPGGSQAAATRGGIPAAVVPGRRRPGKGGGARRRRHPSGGDPTKGGEQGWKGAGGGFPGGGPPRRSADQAKGPATVPISHARPTRGRRRPCVLAVDSTLDHRLPTSPMPAIVRIVDLVKNYYLGTQTVHVLKGLNLSFDEGDFVALMGPSGSGKSTLLNLLGCLDRPTSGQLLPRRRGRRRAWTTTSCPRSAARYLGFIFQSYNLLPQYTVVENIELPLLYQGIQLNEPTQRAVHRAGRDGRPGRPARPPADAALRRPAAARGHRPQPGQRPARDPGRRADRQPRLARPATRSCRCSAS